MSKFRTYKSDERERARAGVECMDEEASDCQVEIVELVDADGPFWAVNVSAFGPRPVRVFLGGSLEEITEWNGQEWS